MSRRVTLAKPPVVEVEHVSTSASVNPRYRITFADGSSYLTGKDSAVAYTITNSDYREGDVIIEVEGGDLVTIRRADEGDEPPAPLPPRDEELDQILADYPEIAILGMG